MTLPRVTDSGDLGQRIAAEANSARGVRMMPGTVTGVDETGMVTVNVAGVDLAALTVPGAVPLAAGDNVTVLRQGGTYRVIGLASAVTPPLSGTVASVPSNSSTIIVSCTLGTLALPWLASYTPTVGDSVLLASLGSGLVVLGAAGKTGAPPAPAPPPEPKPAPAPPPQQRVTTGTTSFTCTGSGTYRSGDWLGNGITNGNVMQGSYPGYGANSGAWFYGGRVHSTLRGATVTGAKIWLGRTQGGTYAAQTVHLSRVSQDRKPSGALSFDSSHATDSIKLAVGQRGWFTLPKSIAQALVDSGGSLGVTSSNPYVRLLGRQNDSRAGQLRISWKRTS